MVSVVSRLVRSWFLCGSGFWLHLSVARFWLAEAGLRCSLQFNLGVLAFCRVGSGDTLWPVRTLACRQVVSSRHSATSGRRVIRARLVFWRSGASGMGANAVDNKDMFGCFQKEPKAAGASHDSPRAQTCTLAPVFKTPPKFHEKTSKRGKKE